MSLLEARDLVKQYHNRRVVDGVNLQVSIPATTITTDAVLSFP